MLNNNTNNLLGADKKEPSHSTTIIIIMILSAILSVILFCIGSYFSATADSALDGNAIIYNWKYISANREASLFDASAVWKDSTRAHPIDKAGGSYLRLTGELPPSDSNVVLFITSSNNKLKVTADNTVILNTLNESAPFVGNRDTMLALPASNHDTHLDIEIYCPLDFDFSASVFQVGTVPRASLFYTYLELLFIGLFFATSLCLLLIWSAARSAGRKGYLPVLLCLITLFEGASLLLNRSGLKIANLSSPIVYHSSLLFSMGAYVFFLLFLSEKNRYASALRLMLLGSFAIVIFVLLNPGGVVTVFLIRCFGVWQAICLVVGLIGNLKDGRIITSKICFTALLTVLFLQCVNWLTFSTNRYLIYVCVLIVSAVYLFVFIRRGIASESAESGESQTKLLGTDRSQALQLKTIETIISSKCNTENNHIIHVAEYVRIMCLHMNKSVQDADVISKAALLHDIGKIVVPTRIMFKQEQLTKDEYEQIQSHVFYGYNILTGSNDEFFNLAADIAKQHHEHFDGTGYLGIKGKSIHPYARITAIADVFDALTNTRSYKEAWGFEESFNYILIHSGDYFDPEMVNVFNAGRFDIEAAYQKFQKE